jgi:outer membrane protein OmpA-like peptidoglycan-associated protein
MTEETRDAQTGNTTPDGPQKPNKLLPWVVLLLAATALLYFLNRGCAGQNGGEKDATELGESMDTDGGAVLTRLAAAVEAGRLDPNTAYVLDKVKFEQGSAEITASAKAQLEALASLLQKHDKIKIRIEAHTDIDGSVQDNLDLSVKQALAVKNHLLDRYIRTIRIAVVGRGNYNQIFTDNSIAGRAKNNRVEVYLSEQE